MNKQELIEKYKILESNSRSNCLDDSFSRGEDSGTSRCCFEIISDLEQLDEPKKEVVPQDVADFIEDGNRYDKIAFLVHQKYLGINSLMRECPVKDWLRSVDYKTVLSLVNGYEVEKEPRWVIKVGNMYFINWGEDGCTPTFVLNDILGQEEQIPKWFSKESADKIAKQLGGTAEWWEDGQ